MDPDNLNFLISLITCSKKRHTFTNLHFHKPSLINAISLLILEHEQQSCSSFSTGESAFRYQGRKLGLSQLLELSVVIRAFMAIIAGFIYECNYFDLFVVFVILFY